MIQHTFSMPAPPEAYRQRRARLGAALTRPMVILAGCTRNRNGGCDFPFRADSTYLYFGGPPLEGAGWLVEPGGDGTAGCTLLRPPAGLDDAVWIGESPGDQAIASAAGVGTDALARPDDLTRLLNGRQAVAICPQCPTTREWTAAKGLQPADSDELLPIIDLRLIKDQHELVALRRAAEVSIAAHRVAMGNTVAGQSEAQVAAAYLGVIVAQECSPSFSPIVTVRGEVLHCVSWGNIIQTGNLLLLDGGAEEPGGYACDITRVWPVGGVFSPLQKQLYETVLRALRAAIDACLPGRRFREIHDLAGQVICEGLVEAGLLRGDPAELAGRRAQTLFFPHGVGHLIGLDVHDMEDFGDLAGYAPGRVRPTQFGDRFLRLDRDLEAGMTVTIEPGIYLVPAIWERKDLVGPFADCVNRPAVDALLADGFGGIRLEDTVHVRQAGGPEVLSGALAIEADEVAAIVKGP